MKKVLKGAKGVIVFIFTYITLVIDRIILIPFIGITSYSAQELQKQSHQVIANVMIRVIITVIISAIVALIMLLI